VAAVHSVFGIVVLGGTFAPLLHRGLFNTVTLSQPSAPGTTFWFFVSGVLAFVVGGLVDYLERLGIAFPVFLPWALLALTIAGCTVMPVSAWWLLLVPVAGMFARRRRAMGGPDGP
jgi:hypothetical protein